MLGVGEHVLIFEEAFQLEDEVLFLATKGRVQDDIAVPAPKRRVPIAWPKRNAFAADYRVGVDE
ncbi:hypothetical protein [Hymenobacter defluvii]|uniref:Uncharacterized protein n=1 Tax=Hymenobacter defluvii TaxID=2054411 RepID=A0ABS3TDK5_9BACT|nr:hypothetical protein [Hymenobacter defluvii]MBO3271746.1 hypothetical protein [Hymenobacter defluvii]